MDSEKIKGKPLTKDETIALLKLIEGSKIITAKTTNATKLNILKTEEWIRIAERFNAKSTSGSRTAAQLRLKWENLKKNARRRSNKLRMNHIKIDGFTADQFLPEDEALDRVISLLGSTTTGHVDHYGGDKDTGGVSFGDDRMEEMYVSLEGSNGDGDSEGTVGDNNDVSGDEMLSVSKHPHRISTPRATGYRMKINERTRRDKTLANYFDVKTRLVKGQYENILLQNEKLKLENEKLRLEISKLKDNYE